MNRMYDFVVSEYFAYPSLFSIEVILSMICDSAADGVDLTCRQTPRLLLTGTYCIPSTFGDVTDGSFDNNQC